MSGRYEGFVVARDGLVNTRLTHSYGLGVVMVVRERRELGGLRRDFAVSAFVSLCLGEVDLGCAGTLVVRKARVVFSEAGVRPEGERIREEGTCRHHMSCI